MKPELLTVQVVTWNSAPVLPALLESLRKQELQPLRLTVIDNHSKDESIALVEQTFPKATIIRNPVNAGFCAAHNQGIRIAETPYIALVNPDVIVSRRAFTALLAVLEREQDIGSIGTKLLKDGGEHRILDSAGILATRYHEFLNRGEGECDQGQYDRAEEVFGLSGAFTIFRRTALAAVRINNEYLDEDFFAYKDDIDLAWRLRSAGWRNWYAPSEPVIHRRHAQHETHLPVWKRRSRKLMQVNRLGYRNHLLTLMKNDRLRDWLLPWPRVLLYEMAKLCFLALFERSTLVGAWQAFRLWPVMRRKRRVIRQQQRVAPASLSAWLRS